MRDSRERTNAVNALDMRVDVLSERRELADTSLEPIHRIDAAYMHECVDDAS
jgi:hypothetical protein